jgi:ACS family tartrate transporter-like MFS transporter
MRTASVDLVGMPAPTAPDERAIFSKVRARLIPFMFLLYVVAYLDRVNIGFAALQMNRDLGFSPQDYARGASIFFVGYTLFEVPSNLLMARVGARLWIARIMIVWGIVSALVMLVSTVPMYFGLRLLLGIAEAGFFPGMILYLTYWFPATERAKVVAQFMTATAMAGVIGGPLSGTLLNLNGRLGLAGWQWLFLIEGIPAVLLGIIVLFYLTERPEKATWLSDAERDWLVRRMDEDRRSREATPHASSLAAAFRNPGVWLCVAIYFTITCGLYGISFWLPQILKKLAGWSDLATGFVAAVPYVAASIAMVFVGASSDRTGERRWHLGLSLLVASAGLWLSGLATTPWVAILAMSLAAAGVWGGFGPFWALPTSWLSGPAAAGGIALINALGNLGGVFGPQLVGELLQRTQNFGLALTMLALCPLVGAVLVLSARRIMSSETAPTPTAPTVTAR